VTHGAGWESTKVDGNGLNPHWTDASFEIVASHAEVTQAVFSVCYRTRPGEKARPLAVTAASLGCVRSGVRCLTMRDPKTGLPLRFCKLLLRVVIDPVGLNGVPAATEYRDRGSGLVPPGAAVAAGRRSVAACDIRASARPGASQCEDVADGSVMSTPRGVCGKIGARPKASAIVQAINFARGSVRVPTMLHTTRHGL